MQPKEFLYFLLNKNSASYYQNNGVVTTSTTPTPLVNTPDGWQDKTVKWERSTKYFGLFRSFTTPLKFVRGAAQILRDRFYKYGTEDVIYLLILWLDKSYFGGWTHRTFFKGELDLSMMSDEQTNCTVNIMEGDLIKLFKANENTTYEIPVTGPFVKYDGLKLKNNLVFTTIDESFVASPFGTTLFGYRWATIQYISNEGTNFALDVGSTIMQIWGSNANDDDNRFTDAWFLRAKADVTFNLQFPWKMDLHNYLTYDLYLKNSNGNRQVILTRTNPNPLSPILEHVDVLINVTVTMAKGETLFLIDKMRDEPSVGGPAVAEVKEALIGVPFDSIYRTTYVQANTLMQMGQALLDKMAGPGYTFQSNYFSTTWSNLLVTSGDAIRGLSDSVIKTSWSDFFDSTDVPCNISLTIKGKVLSVEPKAAAYDNTLVQALGEAGDLKIKTDVDSQFNVVTIGYPPLDTHSFDSLNAKNEFNVTSTFTSPITRVSKTLELVSKYKASMFEQEITRINLAGKTTTADSTDNDVFFVLAEKTTQAGTGSEPATYYKLLRETYTLVDGLYSPDTAFNMPLSPKRCLLAHGDYLRSVFYWQDAGKLVFQSSDTAAILKTVKAGVTIQENADVIIGTLAAPLFIPLDFDINTPMPRSIVNTMKNTPAGTFSFEWNGETFYGFAKSIAIQVANRPAQDTVLLCSPLSDLSKLIH